jgi:hypothetical protein
MLSRIAARLTYANVTATIALFIALGGGAYAATKLPRNSVGSAQIKTGAITPPKLAKSTIVRFKGQKGDKGDPGASGAQGPQGPAGNEGQVGPAGSALAYAHVNADGTFDPARSKNVVGTELFPAATAIYCISFSVAPHNVSATLVGSGTNGQIATFFDPAADGCIDGTHAYQIKVATSNASGAATTRSFDIVVN